MILRTKPIRYANSIFDLVVGHFKICAHVGNNLANAVVDLVTQARISRPGHSVLSRFFEGMVQVAEPLPSVAGEALMCIRKGTKKGDKIPAFVKGIHSIDKDDMVVPLRSIKCSQKPRIVSSDSKETVEFNLLPLTFCETDLFTSVGDLLPDRVCGNYCGEQRSETSDEAAGEVLVRRHCAADPFWPLRMPEAGKAAPTFVTDSITMREAQGRDHSHKENQSYPDCYRSSALHQQISSIGLRGSFR